MITEVFRELPKDRLWYVLNSTAYDLVPVYEYIKGSKTRYSLLAVYWWNHTYNNGSTFGRLAEGHEFSGTIGFKNDSDLLKFKLACPGKFTLVKHH